MTVERESLLAGGLPTQYVDVNPDETREWIESLDNVVDNAGNYRARYLMLSLLRHVSHSYHPHTAVLVVGSDGRKEPVPAEPGRQTAPGLLVYRFGSDLFYANENRFAEEVRLRLRHLPVANQLVSRPISFVRASEREEAVFVHLAELF